MGDVSIVDNAATKTADKQLKYRREKENLKKPV